MAKVIEKNGKKYWIDPAGDEIPEQYIRPEDKKRDNFVESVMKTVIDFHEKMKKEKTKIETKTQDYLDKVAASYGEDWKGNARISNFSNDKTVEISVSELIDFDERLQIAKQKIDTCVKKWTDKSNEALTILVTKAFKTDKMGQLNKKLILQLRSYNIKDSEWLEAMDIINDSIKVVNSKTYYNFYVRDESGKTQSISLNFSNI